MKTFQRFLMGLGAIAVFAVALQLAQPDAVHAMVAALVRDVDNPARLPTVFATCFGQNAAGDNPSFVGCLTNYTIPSGQRLVIEQVEATCQTPSGNNFTSASLGLQGKGQFFGTSHPLVLTSQGPGASGSVQYATNQPVRYYVDAGSTLSFAAFTSDTTASSDCTFQLNGYLINYP